MSESTLPPLMSDRGAALAERRLTGLFQHGEWTSERVWLRSHQDRNPFMSANILLILERCGAPGDALQRQMESARARLASYRQGHRAWHWPLREGRSAMANAPMLWRHRWVEISPDADCTCLVQLARREPGMDDAILEDLAFYRADGERFRLPAFQRSLPGAAGSFLTWFPPRERCHSGKIETVDAGVDANILWYLGTTSRLDAEGAAETARFLTETVRTGLVLRAPFRISMYYPKSAVLLFLISRAAVWGEVPALLALKAELLGQLAECPARSPLEMLCRDAAIRLWTGTRASDAPIPTPSGTDAFYVGPLLAWPLQRCAPLLGVAAQRRTHIQFRCEALEWALYLWLQQPA
ncbi:MAG: hypothetical protein ACHQU1_04880 [Gemmatimonadales bacterium]